MFRWCVEGEAEGPVERERLALGCELAEVERRARFASRAGAIRETAGWFDPPDPLVPSAPAADATAEIEGFGSAATELGTSMPREWERARGVLGLVLYENEVWRRPVSGFPDRCLELER